MATAVKLESVKREAEEEPETASSKKVKTVGMQRNADGDGFVELGGAKRRCTVRSWKGNVLVDVREVCAYAC